MKDEVRNPVFHGDGLALLGMQLLTALLTILTFGIYYFWGKAKLRRYLYSQLEFEGDRFAYHGTGKELFIGWLKAICILLPVGGIVAVLNVSIAEKHVGQALGMLVLYGFLGFLVPVVIVGAWRFRLSRTSWREIRFSFRGKATEFLALFVKGALLSLVTLGLYGPYLQMNMRRYLAEHTYFGNAKFSFHGQGGPLLGRVLLAVLLYVPTFGLYTFWFLAWRERYLWENTEFHGARFRSTVTGGDLLGFHLLNGLLILFTLGLALPWVIIRTRRFQMEHLTLEGTLDLAAIQQDARAASHVGEGLADMLDLGVLDFDLGL